MLLSDGPIKQITQSYVHLNIMSHSHFRLLLAFIAINVFVISIIAEEKPLAVMKAEYSVLAKSHLTSDGDTVMTENDFVLQIAPGYSCYYSPRTYYVDSLQHDPAGQLVYDRISREAMEAFMTSGKNYFESMKAQGLFKESSMFDVKDFGASTIFVWDSTGGDRHHYKVEMSDLVWEIGDSTRNILGYECILATADYHGRKWQAWFAPEIPVQDGPWQFCGLPGLIMDAESTDGLFSFRIKGLNHCSEPLKSVFDPDKYFLSKRESFLKITDHSRRNRSSSIKALTGGRGKPQTDNAVYFDLIETDYRSQ